MKNEPVMTRCEVKLMTLEKDFFDALPEQIAADIAAAMVLRLEKMKTDILKRVVRE